jgi:hypothetical protein
MQCEGKIPAHLVGSGGKKFPWLNNCPTCGHSTIADYNYEQTEKRLTALLGVKDTDSEDEETQSEDEEPNEEDLAFLADDDEDEEIPLPLPEEEIEDSSDSDEEIADS